MTLRPQAKSGFKELLTVRMRLLVLFLPKGEFDDQTGVSGNLEANPGTHRIGNEQSRNSRSFQQLDIWGQEDRFLLAVDRFASRVENPGEKRCLHTIKVCLSKCCFRSPENDQTETNPANTVSVLLKLPNFPLRSEGCESRSPQLPR